MANDREKTCQVKMYGGEPCGRPLYDGDQCICHSENINRPPDLFQRELDKVFADEEAKYYDLTRFVFPKEDYTLPPQYNKDVRFNWARFLGNAHFCGVQFSQEASFFNVRFLGRANFMGATFSAEAAFPEARFSGDSAFQGARFLGRADFSSAQFSGTATFANAQFRTVSFRKCEAGEKAAILFDGESLRKNNEEMFLEEADFTEFTFSNPKNVRFRMVNLSKCRFLETDVSGVQFIDVTWATRPSLIRQQLSRVKPVRERPEKKDTLRQKGIYDELAPDREWSLWNNDPDKKDQDEPAKYRYNLIAQLYRRLQANYINNYQYAEAGDFYIGEQEMMRKAKGKVRQFLSTNFLYKYMSYYGQNFVLPFFWLAATLLLFPAVFLWDGVKLYADYEWSWSLSDFLLLKADYWICFSKNLSFCTFNRSGLSEFITEPHQHVLLTAEIVLIITLVAFVLLALRRKFRRKSF